LKLESNIWKLYIIKACKWMTLFMPVLFLFYVENGLGIRDLFLIQSIYSVTIAVIEIPSGFLADVLGRKRAIILGMGFGFLGMLLYALSHGFSGFLIAALSLGVGQSFVSGSDTALMYDTCAKLDRTQDFLRLEGRTVSMGNLAEAIAFIAGGVLAEFSLRTPFYVQVGIALIGLAVSATLVEPQFDRLVGGTKEPFKHIKSIVRFAILENRLLRNCILYSSIFGCATLVMAWYSQPYFKEIGLQVIYFGIVGAVLNLAVAVLSYFAHVIEQRIKTEALLCLFLAGICGGFFALAYTSGIGGLIVLVIFYSVRGVLTPVLREYMNKCTPSHMRATVMSIRSFIIRCLFAALSPYCGYLAEVYSLKLALVFSGALFLILGLAVLLPLITYYRGQEES